jgi:iron complex outermembrane recepter protein
VRARVGRMGVARHRWGERGRHGRSRTLHAAATPLAALTLTDPTPMTQPFLRARLAGRAVLRSLSFAVVGALAAAAHPHALGAAPLGAAATLAAVPAPAPIVVGSVVDTAGRPLPNARVVVSEVARATTTNAAGEFTIRGLPPGEYHLSITHLGYAPGHLVVRVPAEGDAVRVRAVLRETPLRLSSVVVSASPTGTESERLTQAAFELSGAALQRQVAASVAASLASEPGVSQRFAGPTASMPVIRGLTGDRILVLQDGERAGDLASSSPDHAVSLDPLSAQRIEVVRGPASLLYGNNALGGVVNVIANDVPTSVPTHLEGQIGLQTESATPGAALHVALANQLGAHGAISFRGGIRDMAPLRTGGGAALDGTDAKALNGTLGFGWIGERANVGLAIRHYDFDYGIGAEPGDPEAGVRIDGKRGGASARGGLQLNSTRVPYLRFEGSGQVYVHDEIEPDGAIATTFNLRTQTLNLQATTALGRWKGAVGVQGLGKQYRPTGDEALTPAANSTGLGLFLFQERPLSRHADDPEHATMLQLGARYDDYRISSEDDADFGPGTRVAFGNLSGSVGLSFPIGEGATLSGSVARAFRAPTVEELFADGFHAAAGSYDIGDASLAAEVSTGAEAILRVGRERVTAQLAAYRNGVANYVTPEIVGDTLVDGELVPLNRIRQEDAVLVGAEASVEVHVGRALVLSAMGDVVRGEFASGAALPFMPPARVGGGLRWEDRRLRLSAEVRHGFAQDRVSGGTVDVATEAYTLLNLTAGTSWLMGNVAHQLTLRADNVTDARYFDASSRIKRFAANPGRNVSLIYQVLF